MPERWLPGAVILAAGAATRMGQLKQLLPYRGRTLVEHAVDQAQLAGLGPVVVVLGASAPLVREAVEGTSAAWVVNENWRSGMGSSLTTGIAKLLAIAPDISAVAILLADQPRVTAHDLSAMSRKLETSCAPMIAASYAGTVGVPALFRNTEFEKLKNLAPEAGARALLRGGETEIQFYPLPEAAIDIDTPADFAALAD